jgi:hypothetical protein
MGRLSANWLKANGFTGKQVFIETGTGSGTGIKYCAPHFGMLHTIELSKEKFMAARRVLRNHPTVKCHLGNSPDVLRSIINPKRETLFWLDSHFVATDGLSAGEEKQCPVMEELVVIFAAKWRVLPKILIDDARFFSEPFWETERAEPYRKEDWPRLEEIERLANKHGYSVIQYPNDLLLLEPKITTV